MASGSLITQPIQGQLPSVFNQRNSFALTAAAQEGVQATFSVASVRGKVFRIKYRGEEEMVADATRPGQPAASMDVVVVGVAKHISKQWFLKGYTDGADEGPACFSLDGVTPDSTSPQKQSALCANCPHNQWGSRMTEAGKKAKACADTRRLAIVPAGDLENEVFGGPTLLRIPPMSLNNLATYAAQLARRGAPIESVVTRLSFDYEVAYPHLIFSAERWLSEEEATVVVGPDGNGGICAHPLIDRILYDNITEPVATDDGVNQGPPVETQIQPAQQQAPVYTAPQQAAPQPTTPQPAPTPPTTRRRAAGGFGGGSQAPANAPVQSAQTRPNGPAPVQVAPDNMQEAIDSLLSAPV